ncbi:MAG: hypothetical protein ABI353_05955 [Isosphaeraceae bacterium]
MPTTGLSILVLSLLAALVQSTSANDADVSRKRLAAMPLEHRQTLANNLERFDTLPGDEQAAIRRLDQQLADAEPTDRQRYLDVMRRYHVWLQTLTKDQRQGLAAASPEQRMALVKRYRVEQRQTIDAQPTLDWVQLTRLTTPDLEKTARRLKVWFNLDRAERAAVSALRDPDEQATRLDELGRANGVSRDFRRERQDLAARLDVARKQLETELARRKLDGTSISKKRADAVAPRLKAAAVKHRLNDLLIVREFKPEPVDPARLIRFEADLPSWVRESLDPLPPESAWRRLHLLYRLVFPPGQEIAQPASKVKPPSSSPQPAPTLKPPSGAAVQPF